MNEAVTEFASRAAVKLRKQASLANQLMSFIRTSPFRDDPQYSRAITIPLRRPASDTGALVSAAVGGLKLIYRPGFNLAKAGVMLLDLQPDTVQQGELDLDADDVPQRRTLMQALDGLNDRYGKEQYTWQVQAWLVTSGYGS